MLKDIECRAAKPRDKTYKISDSGGLYLEVSPQGGKYWRFKYRFAKSEKRLAIGVYPAVSLAEARQRRDEAKKLISTGIDPSLAKQDQKRKLTANQTNTFKAVALEWHESRKPIWAKKHIDSVLHKLEADLFPLLGNRPIADIDAPTLLEALRKIEGRGAFDMARRAKQIAGQVFRYGIATGRCQRDLSVDLKNALKAYKTTHYACIDPKEVPEFLEKLNRNEVRLYNRTRRAMKLLMLTFVRTSELIKAKWSEFDLDAAQWIIPAERMKMRKPHIVPLSRQAIALLQEQKSETERLNCEWVFPSQIGHKKSMSNNTILAALKNLGYQSRMTGHGFRALARTMIREELGYDPDVIECQLAHLPAGYLRDAYDRSKHLVDRKVMMQEWADLIDAKAAGNVIYIKSVVRK